jgi:glycosyltransferase involved in cell wall biosynthesis
MTTCDQSRPNRSAGGAAAVSVIVPCRNEKEFIVGFLESVLEQDYPPDSLEVLVADGRSTDGTRALLETFSAAHPRVKVVDNPELTTPFALNRAIRSALGEIIVRMDVHSRYAADYISRCVVTLEQTGADNVGGAWHAEGKSFMQKAVALAFQSPFSSGGAGSHALNHEGIVDSVYLGCWHKTTLEKIGFFDEEFVRNQDDELNLRITRSGGKIWQSPSIKSWYYPRASLPALFQQYKQYGYWKVRVIQKHRMPASLRHVVPGSFVACLLVLALLSVFYLPAFLLLGMLLSCYFLGTVLATIVTCRRPETRRYAVIMPFVFAAFHFGYGYGFLRGVIDFVIFRKGGQQQFATITRG